MILIDQKKSIYNFSLIYNIYADSNAIFCNMLTGKPVLLGSYKSNDRAQEVMEWIVKEYEKQLSPNTVSIRMPQE